MKMLPKVLRVLLVIGLTLVASAATAQMREIPPDELRAQCIAGINKGEVLDFHRKRLQRLTKKDKGAKLATDFYYIGLAFQKEGEGLKAITNYTLVGKTKGAPERLKRLAANRIAEIQGRAKPYPFESLLLEPSKSEEARKKRELEEKKKRIIETYLDIADKDAEKPQPKPQPQPQPQPKPKPKPIAERWPELSAPASVGGGDKDAAVVVGVEDYAFVADVPGAKKNANDWFVYLTKGRKVPVANVKLLRNNEATRERILETAKKAAAKVKPGGTLWFVFIGHGAPAKSQKDGVLVGFDAQQDVTGLYARSLAQEELLTTLNEGRQARTVAVLDACFSGRTAGGALAQGLQPLLPVKIAVPKKTVVLTAGKGSEFAGPLHNVQRPAFSYLLLGAMRGWGDANRDGQVTVGEAVEYTRQAMDATLKGRQQTPEVIGAGGSWLLASGAREQGPDLANIVLGE